MHTWHHCEQPEYHTVYYTHPTIRYDKPYLLHINLHQYNAELAKTVDEFVGTQEKLSQKISDLNEQGIRAVIDESGKSIKILTEQEVQSKIIDRNSKIKEVEILRESITKAFKEATLNPKIKKQ